MADQAAAGWGGLLRGQNALRSLALAGGVALHAVNVYVTITILPSVVADIGGLDYYAWNTSLFILASIMGSALSPRVLASLGPRGGYRFATVVFAAGAVICAIAPLHARAVDRPHRTRVWRGRSVCLVLRHDPGRLHGATLAPGDGAHLEHVGCGNPARPCTRRHLCRVSISGVAHSGPYPFSRSPTCF